MSDSFTTPIENSISELVHARCAQHADGAALLASGLRPLSFRQLAAQMDYVGRAMRTLGIESRDRVAVALPNGPDMAAAFLGVAAFAACAPLNPQFRTEEFDFYLRDLQAKAVVLPAEVAWPAREVARRLGLTVIDLSSSQATTAGNFHIQDVSAASDDAVVPSHSEDVALLLHTSGTTSRPKLVPLSHRNLCASARNIANVLDLTCEDRCLNVMPLFHIHGLVGGLLSSLASGASVVCSPGYERAAFHDWMNEFDPTWYTAVPTILQAIIAQSGSHGLPAISRRLRFIRSSSSSLPPTVMTELEQIFGVPVIESYGMTEAAHQMASNPLPPGIRIPGSVGLPAGVQMAIVNEEGKLLDCGAAGEIVIRGLSVTKGYVNNPQANAAAFNDGWFRTGDLGRMDEDGYFFITGRTKEMINRGGENISPREVDEVLLEHAGVAQAVAFAVPHKRLGEDLVAAVVPRDDTTSTEQQLREYALTRLADFKVPSQIVFVSEIPKGPTGKLQRIGLHEKLGPLLRPEHVPAKTTTEKNLKDVWRKVLDCECIGIHDNFFRLGGDSLMATHLMVAIHEMLQVELPLRCLMKTPTIAGLSKAIDEQGNRPPAVTGASLRLIHTGTDTLAPFFLVPGGGEGEDEFRTYAHLIHLLGPEQRVYGLYARGLDGRQPPHTDVESMASDYLQEVLAERPDGPYFFGGECIGGIVALEMARQLQSQSRPVGLLILMNTELPRNFRRFVSRLGRRAADVLQVNRVKYHWSELRKRPLRQQHRYILDTIKASNFKTWFAPTPAQQTAAHIQHVRSCYQNTIRRHVPRTYTGVVNLLVSEDHDRNNLAMGWDRCAVGGLETHHVPGDRDSYLGKYVATTADQLRACLKQAQEDQHEGGFPP